MQSHRTPESATPYAADGGSNFYGVQPVSYPDPAHYGEPQGGNTQYITAPGGIGWATPLKESVDDTPDPQRIEEMPRTDRRANLRNPWVWWKKYDAETEQRESVTSLQATGFTENKGPGDKAKAPDPRWVPPPEPRPTTAMSPHTFLFQRPFDQTIARRLTGKHVSLADNRRQYEILTMAPVTPRRNTYRIEPSPWDTDIVDQTAPVTEGRPDQRLQSPDIPLNPRSAFRLG
jgi:hypothetical protein